MYVAASFPLAAAPARILDALPDLRDLHRASDAEPQIALALVAGLAFLAPALVALRLSRRWQACMFAFMAVVCTGSNLCTPVDAPTALCPAGAGLWFKHGYQAWLYVCLLQMAFLVLGPEDPQLQTLGATAPAGAAARDAQVPWDVVLTARVAPAVALCLLQVAQAVLASGPGHAVQLRSALLAELLLVGCTAAFWAEPRRRSNALDVLLRFKYWHRLLHHGIFPAMMLCWTFCISGLSDRKVASVMWHVVMSAFAVSVLRTSSIDAGSPGEEVFDVSVRNPSVPHVLLSCVALTLWPTAIVGVSYDWCSSSGWRWPTVASAASCETGSYFVAIAAVPVYVSGAAAFWLVGSVARSRTAWSSTGNGLEDYSELPCGVRQRRIGMERGCLSGQVGCAVGLASAFVMHGSLLQDVLARCLGLASLALVLAGMVLTTLSADQLAQGFFFRRSVTLYVCVPLVALNAVLGFAVHCLPAAYACPHGAYAVSEYVLALTLSLWPLTWIAEVHEESQRKPSGTFSWPVTAWRFQ